MKLVNEQYPQKQINVQVEKSYSGSAVSAEK